MRKVALVTTARSEWGAQRTIAAALRESSDVELHIIAAGMHLAEEFGYTAEEIIADGFEISHKVDFLQPGDSPETIGISMGTGVQEFSRLFARWRPDILTVLGDRFDMFPAALAAVPFLIPVAHIHGGEVTTGAFDDSLRHAMTKLSHIHFVATEDYARRVHQMGENPDNIHVVGAPAIDDIESLQPASDADLQNNFGFTAGETNILMVYHPETLAHQRIDSDIVEVLRALTGIDGNILIIRPNADTGNRTIQEAIDAFAARHSNCRVVTSIPRKAYLSLLKNASLMLGNSSSGILEAPSFAVPVINIGNRQSGRVKAKNIIDCSAETAAISAALEKGLSQSFGRSIRNIVNPYGTTGCGKRIAEILAGTDLDSSLLLKGFRDL